MLAEQHREQLLILVILPLPIVALFLIWSHRVAAEGQLLGLLIVLRQTPIRGAVVLRVRERTKNTPLISDL